MSAWVQAIVIDGNCAGGLKTADSNISCVKGTIPCIDSPCTITGIHVTGCGNVVTLKNACSGLPP